MIEYVVVVRVNTNVGRIERMKAGSLEELAAKLFALGVEEVLAVFDEVEWMMEGVKKAETVNRYLSAVQPI